MSASIELKSEITRLQMRAAGRLVLMDARMHLRDAWAAVERGDLDAARRLVNLAVILIEGDGR